MTQCSQSLSFYTDLNNRLNPQFKQVTTRYLHQKKQRKQIQKRKTSLSNQVKHYKNLNQSLQKSLQKKQLQLEYLKQVRERYLSGIQNRKDKDQQNKRKIEQLRLQNTSMKNKSIQNIHDALDDLHRKKSKAHKDVINNLNQLKRIYTQKKAAIDFANQSVYQQMRRSKIKGKNHINKFFRKKNTQLTQAYKQMLQDQQFKFIQNVKQIQNLGVKQSRYKQKINKKQQKMSKLLEQIDLLKRSSHQIALGTKNKTASRFNNSFNGASKVSKTERTEMESTLFNNQGDKKNNKPIYGFSIMNGNTSQINLITHQNSQKKLESPLEEYKSS